MELKKLNLSLPSMDSDDCKSLMGGDGYIMLDEVVVVAPGNERPDDEYDPFLENDQDENNQDENYYEESDRDDNSNSDNDDSQSSDYTIPEQVNNAFESLPKAIQEYLKSHGINIIYDPDIIKSGAPGGYSPNSGNITVANGDVTTLLHEAIHAIQGSLGILDERSLSAEEFQAHALLDAYQAFFSLIEGRGNSTTLDSGFNGEGNSGWNEFLQQCIIEGGDSYSFDRDYFINHVMDYFDLFQQSHQNSGHGYTDPLENNYNWSWEKFLDMLGL